MRPKVFTLKNFILLLLATTIFTGLALWGSKGFPMPFGGVPSTVNKIIFVSDRDGQPDLYMADSKSKEIVRLTKDKAEEAELAFAPDGQKVAYTANINGNVRQLCLTEASPDRKVIGLTRTQSTKEQPAFDNDNNLYFLDSGKVARTTTDASDSDAIFPTVESKRDNPALATLFAEGGIARFALTPDGNGVVAAIKRERTEILVLYSKEGDAHVHEAGTLVLIGFAQKLRFQFLSDGSLTVLFQGGTPLKEPMQLPTPKGEEESKALAGSLEQLLAELSGQAEGMEGQNILVHFGPDLKVTGGLPVPFPADDFSIAPNDQTVVLYTTQAHGGQTDGIYLGSFVAKQEPLQRISETPIAGLTWSPDSSQLAYIAQADLFIYSVTGSEAPVNLTQGKGKASSPVWSPVLAEKK